MRSRRADSDPVHMNMVPVMNLFLAMIPFLLMCAAFFQVSVINASVPALSEGDEQEGEQPKRELDKVTLNLQINKQGFNLTASGDQSADDLKKIGGLIPKQGEEYDYEKLAEHVKKIHDKYKNSDTIVILPEKDVLYDTIVRVMDTTRERIVDKRQNNREYLFTNAVVSSIL